MAHQIRNGNYRHKGVEIERNEKPCSTGWAVEWIVFGIKHDTLAQAVAAIEKRNAPMGDAQPTTH